MKKKNTIEYGFEKTLQTCRMLLEYTKKKFNKKEKNNLWKLIAIKLIDFLHNVQLYITTINDNLLLAIVVSKGGWKKEKKTVIGYVWGVIE